MSCQERAAGLPKRTSARTCANGRQLSTCRDLQQSLVRLQAVLGCSLARKPAAAALHRQGFSKLVLPRRMERLLGNRKLVWQFGALLDVLA